MVDNHEQARFVVDLNEKDHYLKKGNEYYFLPRPKGEIDIEKMSKAEWALAKNAFLEKKPDILSVHARHKEQIEVHVGEHTQRINERKDLRLVLMKQLSDLRYAKEDMKGKLTQAKEEEARLLGAPMNKAPTPQPRPQQEHDAKENVYIPKPMPQPGHRSSYSRMMEAFEGLVLTQSPHNKEALEKANALVKEAPTAHQGELKALIGEIKPNMDSNLRLSWLFRAKELISNITPEPDSTSTLDRKGK